MEYVQACYCFPGVLSLRVQWSSIGVQRHLNSGIFQAASQQAVIIKTWFLKKKQTGIVELEDLTS